MATQVEVVAKFLLDIAVWFALVPLFFGALRYKFLSFGLRNMMLLLGIMLMTDIALTFLGDSEQFALYIPRIYTLVEFLAVTIFFASITSRKKLRIAMYMMIAPFIGVVVADFLIEGLVWRDDLSVGIESLIFIAYAMITLYNIMRDVEYPDLLATPNFWIISAILLYFGGNIFVFISTNYIARVSREMFDVLWATHALVEILFYSVLAIGLWKAKESR